MKLDNLFSLENEIAVVTGGAGLLGLQHCTALLTAGAKVVILDVSPGKNSEAVDKLTSMGFSTEDILALECDITNQEQIVISADKIEEHFGSTVSILINNAALDPKVKKDKVKKDQSQKNFSRLENFPTEQWDLEIRVGLTGAMCCAKVFGQRMVEAGIKGSILNISSDLGVIAPDQRIYADPELPESMQNVKPVTYSVIKHGLIGLTKYLATYWADKGIRTNCLAPGGAYAGQPDHFVEKLTKLIPMGRMAEVSEYQGCIIFLCSKASSYINGATINADGGRSVW